MRSLSPIVFFILILLCLAQVAYYYPLLPERVASHFGASGRPDAWSGKDAFVATYLGVVALIAVLFPGVGLLMRKLPSSRIELPRKEHWPAPERKAETIDRLSSRFLWFGSATLLLLLDIFHQSFRVHLGKAQALEHPIVSVAMYLVLTAIWSITWIVQFMRKSR